MSDSNQSPCKVSCNVSCDEHHNDCCDDSSAVHVHVHVHHHHHCCRTAPVKPVALPVIKFGFCGPTVGNPSYTRLLVQVNEPSNYGVSGIYNKIEAVRFLDASKDVLSSPLTAAQLKAGYDVLSIGLFNSNFTIAEAARLKEYAALGGVVLLTFDVTPCAGGPVVLKQFGHTGSFAGSILGEYSGVSSVTQNLSSYFGDSSGVTLKGASAMAITSAQLPSGSRVLATAGANVLFWTVGGTEERVVAMCDVDLMHAEVAGTAVDNGQEKFLNNMMAYLFDKVLENK